MKMHNCASEEYAFKLGIDRGRLDERREIIELIRKTGMDGYWREYVIKIIERG